MTRANARELAVHLIYAREITGEEPESVIGTRLNKDYYPKLAEENEVYSERPSRAQLGYLDGVVSGVANRTEDLNALIRQYSIGWDVNRISRLSRAVLQLALYEIQFVPDVPTGVAISEAVRLAKKYDGDEAGSFVNGILGSYARASQSAAEETDHVCDRL
ncbi:MAG: transcription antitermination factor NusB [Firmicutes bacterium]|nr:transcription antitermination factor NusB [Bacillota bacterium]